MVEINVNDDIIDITNQIKNQINYDRRVDEVFDTGSFTFESKTIDYNIPPLTWCDIDGEYWLCSSECNKIIPSEYYNHNVQLLELTYLLHTIILGSKAFSNKGAYRTHNAKLNIIQELISTKLRIMFEDVDNIYNIEPFPDSKNIEREFTFGAGTSAFQMLLEIGKTVDAIPRLKIIDGVQTITWDYLDNNSIFNLEENRILGVKYFQDVENYTAVLETEIKNVVDRDTIQTINNLSVSSEEAIINSDNQVLILPSKAEKIVDLEYKVPYLFQFFIYYNDSNVVSSLTPDLEGNYYYFSTLKNNDKFAPLALEFERIVNSKGIPLFDNLEFWHYVDNDSTTYKGYFRCTMSSDTTNIQPLNITHLLLEKHQWDLIELAEQPKYLVYESGSNVIDNLYKYYKGDLWSEILGITTYPVLKEYFQTLNFSQNINNGNIEVMTYLTEETSYQAYQNPINNLFNVSYIPIVDTYIRSDNVKTPFNESYIKPSSRSFEAQGNMVDFNLLVDSINRTNSMIGMPEVTITYAGETYPRPANAITIKGQTYYVSSVQTSIISGRYVSYINLVSNYSKIAEVFGVATQYESTKLPLTGIIDRFVYCGELEGIDEATGITLLGTFRKIYKRGVKLSHKGSKYLIVAANDNYVFTTDMVENDNLTSNIFENKTYSYGNGYNEEVSYWISIVKEPDNMSIEQSRNLATSLLDSMTILKEEKLITTYKDARERLLFVFKMI